MTRLSRFIEALTDAITTGKVAELCGYQEHNSGNVIDVKELAPSYEGFQGDQTQVQVAPIQRDNGKFIQNRIFSYEQLSNIMSGYVGCSVNDKKESQVFSLQKHS